MKTSSCFIFGALCATTLLLPFSSLAHNPAVYGTDDRIEISQIKNDKIRNLSRSIVLFATAEHIEPVPGGYVGKYFSPDLPDDGALYKDKRKFSNQASAGYCTGFLIDSTHILTAGHCVALSNSCNNVKLIFDYTAEPPTTPGEKQKPLILSENIKTCKRILPSPNYQMIDSADFAVVELNEPVLDRAPLQLTQSERKPSAGTHIVMMGHPDGKPMKWADGGAQVLKSKTLLRRKSGLNPYEFVTNLDSFSGNSGSPVFDAETLEVIGVLVQGGEDREILDTTVLDRTYPEIPSIKKIQNENQMVGERVMSIALTHDELQQALSGKTAKPKYETISVPVLSSSP